MVGRLKWDQDTERLYETGVDQGVLFVSDGAGGYKAGVAWNGLTAVTESPEGAEETALYADNRKYLSLLSAENFKATIAAYMSPEEFDACDGSLEVAKGVTVGQQTRTPFAFAYRSLIGNDAKATDLGYKIHIIYGAKASPSERARETVNETPTAVNPSWAITTTAVNVPNGKPTAKVTIDSTKVPAAKMKAFEDVLYGTDTVASKLPTIEEIIEMVGTVAAGGE